MACCCPKLTKFILRQGMIYNASKFVLSFVQYSCLASVMEWNNVMIERILISMSGFALSTLIKNIIMKLSYFDYLQAEINWLRLRLWTVASECQFRFDVMLPLNHALKFDFNRDINELFPEAVAAMLQSFEIFNIFGFVLLSLLKAADQYNF